MNKQPLTRASVGTNSRYPGARDTDCADQPATSFIRILYILAEEQKLFSNCSCIINYRTANYANKEFFPGNYAMRGNFMQPRGETSLLRLCQVKHPRLVTKHSAVTGQFTCLTFTTAAISFHCSGRGSTPVGLWAQACRRMTLCAGIF